MKLDLRPRCTRCKNIPRGKIAKANYEKHYPGFCSYHCQEWYRLEAAQRYLNARHALNGDPR